MGKSASELVVITKMYDLVVWGCQHVARFPRSHKFTIGDRLAIRLQNLFDLLVRAKYESADATNDTKTDIVVTVVGCVPVANGRAAVPRIVVPGTTTQHTNDHRPSGILSCSDVIFDRKTRGDLRSAVSAGSGDPCRTSDPRRTSRFFRAAARREE